jgi:hypothetical protein
VRDVEEFYATNAALIPLFLLTASSGLRATDGGAHSNRWRVVLVLMLVVPATTGLVLCLLALAVGLDGLGVIPILVAACSALLAGATMNVVVEQVMRGQQTQPPGGV